MLLEQILRGQMSTWSWNLSQTVGICYRWSQEPTFKVWSKQASYRWDIHDMDKCCLDEYCLDKCHQQLAYVADGPRSLPLKFGQNRVSNSWDIPDMDKCCQDECCVDNCQRDSCNLFKMVPGTFLSSLVNIGPVTVEIFLIWTNVTRTNVARTNVPVTVGICWRWYVNYSLYANMSIPCK